MDKERIIRYFVKKIEDGSIPPEFPGSPEFAVQCYLLYQDGQIDSETWQDLCNGIIEDAETALKQTRNNNISVDHQEFDCVDYIKGNGKWFFHGYWDN